MEARGLAMVRPLGGEPDKTVGVSIRKGRIAPLRGKRKGTNFALLLAIESFHLHILCGFLEKLVYQL